MQETANPRVTMLPVAANFRKHFTDAAAAFRARDICSLCMLAPFEREIEIEKLSQGMAAGLGPKLGAEIYTLSHKSFSEALNRAVNRFISTQNPDHIRKNWQKDVDVIFASMIDLAMTKPKSSGWRHAPA